MTCDETRVRHLDSGLVFRPQLVAVQPLDNGGVRNGHDGRDEPPRAGPDGVFLNSSTPAETTTEASINSGFDQWARTDLVTFLEALRDKPETCMTLEMQRSPGGTAGRRGPAAILSRPVSHSRRACRPPRVGAAGDEHPRLLPVDPLLEAFKGVVQSDGFFAIRLFARGTPPARPTRIVGSTRRLKPGVKALRKYARTWPPAGFEFRKQYVLLRTLPDPGGEPE